MTQRFSILDQLADNWPGKFSQSRISLVEKHLAEFDVPTLSKGIDSVIRSEKYPPTIDLLYVCCKRFQPGKYGRKEQLLRPGDPDPGNPGGRFLTVDEMVEELERMTAEFPEAFAVPPLVKRGDDFNTQSRSDAMAATINRIYVRALQIGISNNGRAIKATQRNFF